MQKALFEPNNELIRKLIDLSSMCIFFTDAFGNCIYANKSWEKIVGISIERALNKGWADAIHPDDREKVFNDWTSGALEGKPNRFEFRFKSPEGIITWVDAEAVKIRDESNQIIGYFGTIKDINSLKISEKALLQRSYFTSAANKIAEVIISKNNSQEILENSYLIICETLKIDFPDTSFDKNNINNLGEWLKKIQVLKPWNSEEMFFLESIAKLLNLGLVKIKLLEENNLTLDLLTQERNKLAAVFENTNIGFALANPTGEDIVMNPAAMRFHGISSERGIPKVVQEYEPHWELYYLNGKIMPFNDWPAMRAIRSEYLRDFKLLYVNTKNNYQWVCSITTMPIKNIKGEVKLLFLTFLDITKEYNLEKELRSAVILAESAAVAKSRFLDIAAHELRTPVTSFSLLLQLTQKQLEKGSPLDPTVLPRLRSQADRISHLVVDLLDVSRLDRGVVKLNLERKNLNSVINECVEDFKLREPGRLVKITKPETRIELNFDFLRIAQVISNLLENARKYTPANSPIEIVIKKKSTHARISVTDHGPGISNEQQSRLFSPFTRGSDDLTSRSGGLGLGLYICSEIIKLHGGTIGVTSRLGEGSTFYFELPLEEDGSKWI